MTSVRAWESWYYEAQKHSVAIDTYEWAKGRSPLDITFPLAACESMSIPYEWEALELWATAPGYEWGRAIADLTSGGEYAIEVRRLGTLRVFLAPELGDVVQVAMRDQRGRREASRTNPAVFDSIPPGYCGIDVVLDDGRTIGQQLTFELGQAQTVVIEPSDLNLGVGAPLPRPLVHLTGRLIVPSVWKRRSVTVVLEKFDLDGRRFEMNNKLIVQEGENGAWLFDAGRVEAGLYQILVEECSWATLFEVQADGEHSWQVPEPVAVDLRCVVSGAGEYVPVQAISWVPVAPSGYESGLKPRSVKASDDGKIEFVAPLGEIELTVSHKGFQDETMEASLTAGTSEVVVPLTKTKR